MFPHLWESLCQLFDDCKDHFRINNPEPDFKLTILTFFFNFSEMNIEDVREYERDMQEKTNDKVGADV